MTGLFVLDAVVLAISPDTAVVACRDTQTPGHRAASWTFLHLDWEIRILSQVRLHGNIRELCLVAYVYPVVAPCHPCVVGQLLNTRETNRHNAQRSASKKTAEDKEGCCTASDIPIITRNKHHARLNSCRLATKPSGNSDAHRLPCTVQPPLKPRTPYHQAVRKLSQARRRSRSPRPQTRELTAVTVTWRLKGRTQHHLDRKRRWRKLVAAIETRRQRQCPQTNKWATTFDRLRKWLRPSPVVRQRRPRFSAYSTGIATTGQPKL
ncbi:hypothetical protein HPB51_021025 [Rhipicephalus microplus]|uniref:Secreted protein n=1 Tax=Rhipicephalus microplus TaxID=6941 RepID=A0A9J6DC96_RHIMP|nr:hypothetical protein HPB51_021025 [Rhipicephalus microplus]